MDTMQEFEYEENKPEEILEVPLRKINQVHIGRKIKTEVVLRSNTVIKVKRKKKHYSCIHCGQKYMKETAKCKMCSEGIIKISGETENIIQAIVEEAGSDLLVERAPVSMFVTFINGADILIDNLCLGGRYTLIGFVGTIKKKEYEELTINVETSNLTKEGIEHINLTALDKEKIKVFSQRDDLIKKLREAVFGTDLYNLDILQESILLTMASSQKFHQRGSLKNRGNINLLFVGSPGLGKSQILKRAISFFPKSRYASCSGSTGIGLMGSVQKDERVGDSVLTPGTVALCHSGGIAAIDELDKVDKTDLSKLNTQMDSLFIPIDKANIHRRLPADVSILAAMNPKYGTYSVEDIAYRQINLAKDFMDRFDLIFNIDYFNNGKSEKMIESSLSGYKEEEQIDTVFFLKYFSMARKIKYKFNKGLKEHIKKEYNKMVGNIDQAKGVHYSSRLNDILVRLTLAHARLHLKQEPDFTDVKRAVELMKLSFKSLGVFDDHKNVLKVIEEAVKEEPNKAKKQEIILQFLRNAEKGEMREDELRSKTNFKDFDKIMNYLKYKTGEIFERRPGIWKLL